MRKPGLYNTARRLRPRPTQGIISQDRTAVVRKTAASPLSDLQAGTPDGDVRSLLTQETLAQEMLAQEVIAQGVIAHEVISGGISRRVNFFAAFFRHSESVVIEEDPAVEPTPVGPAFALETPGRELVTDAETESDPRGGKKVKEFPSIVCPRCSSCRIRRARRSNAFEQFLRLFALAPYRCRACRRKFYRF